MSNIHVEEVIQDNETPVFVLGLAMAGAVSAGAYTSGVLDTLFRALDAHERRRIEGKVKHKVVLKVMSGASAGAISTALGAVSLIDGGLKPHDPDNPEKVGLGRLYDLWVEKVRLTERQDEKGVRTSSLLSITDFFKWKTVRSILDSNHINDGSLQVLSDIYCEIDEDSRFGFIATELELMMTTTMLQGVAYEVKFSNEAQAGHLMANHSLVHHFKVKGLGNMDVRSPWLDRWEDQGTILDLPPKGTKISFDNLWVNDPAELTGFESLGRIAVASGAFPIGLSSRLIGVKLHQLHNTAWPVDLDPCARKGGCDKEESPLNLVHSEDIPADGVLRQVAVDGGVANNEPFELARYTIRDAQIENGEWSLRTNPRSSKEADRAVIMIDPFPKGPKTGSIDPGKERQSIISVLMKLPGALINQARFKPAELIQATDKDVFSRFLIAPSRRCVDKTQCGVNDDGKLRGGAAIASGIAGGFGGFFDRRFREHDYRLGQQNARDFLMKYFVLADENAIFAGQKGLNQSTCSKGKTCILQFDPGKDLPNFKDKKGLFHPNPQKQGERWPVMTQSDFNIGQGLAEKRIQSVLMQLPYEFKSNWAIRQLVKLGAKFAWSGVLRKLLRNSYFASLKKEMEDRGQLEKAP